MKAPGGELLELDDIYTESFEKPAGSVTFTADGREVARGPEKQEKPAAAKAAGSKVIWRVEVYEIIRLLNYIKKLAEQLPEKERNIFKNSGQAEVLDSLIDSLRKLIIIKE